MSYALKSSALLLATALSFHAAADIDPTTLPLLPDASDLTPANVGQMFSLEESPSSEVVFLAGFNHVSTPVVVSYTDIATDRGSYQDAVNACAAKGWSMPAVDDLRMITPIANALDLPFLPGSHWTRTTAPSQNDVVDENLKIAYDVMSGNVRNSYVQIFRYYTTCVLYHS